MDVLPSPSPSTAPIAPQPIHTMATAATLLPQGIPERNASPPNIIRTSTPSILEEVRAAQTHLQARLAGALTQPPANVPESLLPTVPLIDLSPSFTSSLNARKEVAAQIRAACLTTGFFQISNHGINSSAITSVLTQAQRFFHDLTPTQKEELHVKHSPLWRGYEPNDASYVNPDDTTTPETKEGFNWGYEPSLDPTGGDGAYTELDGLQISPGHGNVWPSEEVLPGFHEGIRVYYAQVLQLARHLFRLFALSLGLREGYFDNLTTHPGGIGRLLYYPPPGMHGESGDNDNDNFNSNSSDNVNSSNDSNRDTNPSPSSPSPTTSNTQLGLGAHTDYECFTLLLSTPHPGLEILFPPTPLTDNKPLWRPCPIREGTLTVNVADFLMRWTDGLYKSTVHRVVTRAATGNLTAEGLREGMGGRYSVPFFFSVNYDAEIEELDLPEDRMVVGGRRRNRYKKVKAGEYVLERLKATGTSGEEG